VVDLRGSAEGDKLIAVSGDKHGKIQLLRRSSAGSLALLTLQPQPAALPGVASFAGMTAATGAVAVQESWPEVAIFRLREDPATKKPVGRSVTMAAHRDGKSIQLSGTGGRGGLWLAYRHAGLESSAWCRTRQAGTFLPDESAGTHRCACSCAHAVSESAS